MSAASLDAVVPTMMMHDQASSGLVSGRAYRPMILAAIIGLHVGILIYATLLKPAAIKPPEIAPVAMMQLIAAPSLTASMQTATPAPPREPVNPEPRPVMESEPEPAPPKPTVVKTAPVLPKPVPKPLPKQPPKPIPKAVVKTPEIAVPAPVEPSARPEVAEQPDRTALREAESSPVATPTPPAETASPPSFSAAYLNNPPPAYPTMARRMGEEGRVMLRVFVTPQGTAGEVEIFASSGSAMFDNAAQEAVMKWRFVPARKGESTVAAWVKVPIVFKLS